MRVAAIGECMIEMAEAPSGEARRSFGGDTLNTAVYLARLGIDVDYVTALGDDPYSDEMLAAWRDEGVGVALADEQGHAGCLLELLGATEARDGRHSGESFGVVEAHPHGAAAAHRMSHDVYAPGVDRIGRLDQV